MHIINLVASSLQALASINFSVAGTSPHPPIIIDTILKAIGSILGF